MAETVWVTVTVAQTVTVKCDRHNGNMRERESDRQNEKDNDRDSEEDNDSERKI